MIKSEYVYMAGTLVSVPDNVVLMSTNLEELQKMKTNVKETS